MPARQSLGRLPLVTAALVVALVAMACGWSGGRGVASLESADPGGNAAASPSPSTDPEEAALAFAECMRDHGIDMPDPQIGSNGDMRITIGAGGPGEIDRDEMQAAMEACRELMPGGGLGGPGGRELTPEDQDRMLAFTECMREHGVDMPDPQFGEGGGFIRVAPGANGNDEGPAFDPNDTDFQAAQEACRELLPGFGPNANPSEDGSGAGSTETTP